MMDSQKQTKKLVDIINMLPTLNINLSEYQKKVVSSNQNLLCLGRSGTGKTTTSVLRLFAQEILYITLKKHQLKLIEKQQKKEKALALGQTQEEENKDD